MGLVEEVKEKSQEIKTNSYSMSINEIASLYKEGDLTLRPEFQRHFRWSLDQKTRFVESILLGIPIPPIFVGQDEKGKWELIDGLQRISTLLNFMGELKDENNKKMKPLVLSKPKLLPSLEKNTWIQQDDSTELPLEIKLKLKRARLDINIILENTDSSAKYELFQRLNTGGSLATNQEIRNCLLIMVSKQFYTWFLSLRNDENFISSISLSERLIEEQYELELISRFLILKNIKTEEIQKIKDLSSFLDDEIIKLATDIKYDYSLEEEIFRKVFERLYTALQDECFKKYDNKRNKTVGSFIISVFEIMALGLGFHYDIIDNISNDDILRIHHNLYADPNPLNVTGMSASSRLGITIKTGRELFDGRKK